MRSLIVFLAAAAIPACAIAGDIANFGASKRAVYRQTGDDQLVADVTPGVCQAA